MSASCELCRKPATKICSACRSVSYCGIEHQKADWKSGHKSSCRIWTMKTNEIMGRYTVAARDIPAGTVIMDEPALIIGPKQDSLPVCLGCHKRVDGSYLCSKCSLPVCNLNCEKAQIHSLNECKIFSSRKPIKITNYDIHHPVYQCILTVRCLCLKGRDPKRWDKLNKMEHHNSIRKQNTELWNRNENNTVKFLREVYDIDFDAMTIHTVVGYADINAFEIKAEGVEICGLFPDVALMAHDCISNTHHSITDDNRMLLRNVIPIKKGEMITTTYTYTLDGTLDRRRHIKESKLFDCCCARCSSPTELGVHFSSVKCFNCSDGYIFPKDSLNPESLWNCNVCNNIKKVNEIQALVDPIKKELEGFETNPEDIVTKLEMVLRRCSGITLHSQHYLMVNVMHSLSQYYGRTKGWAMHELTLEQLARKEEMCRLLLKVLDVIEPGLSRIRGSTLYELHAAIFFASQQRCQNGDIDPSELKPRLEEVIELLETSMQILSFDSPSSLTGKIAVTIPASIHGVKQILEHFCS